MKASIRWLLFDLTELYRKTYFIFVVPDGVFLYLFAEIPHVCPNRWPSLYFSDQSEYVHVSCNSGTLSVKALVAKNKGKNEL